MRFSIALLILAALSGCGESRQPASKVSQEQRSKTHADRSREPPGIVVHKTETGDMVVMTVPTGGTAKLLDVQRCFIWRDLEFKSTAMSCPGEQADVELTAER